MRPLVPLLLLLPLALAGVKMKHYAEEDAHDTIPHSAYARSSKSHDDGEDGQTWEAVDLAGAQHASNIAEGSADNLESLLHWAIGVHQTCIMMNRRWFPAVAQLVCACTGCSPAEHSDPEKLSEQAAEVKQKQIVSSLGEKKKRVQEVSCCWSCLHCKCHAAARAPCTQHCCKCCAHSFP
jgi:hypothetical protein